MPHGAGASAERTGKVVGRESQSRPHHSRWHAGEESGNEDDVLMHSFSKPTSPALLVWPLHPPLFPCQQAKPPLRTHAKDGAEKGSRPEVQ